MFICVVKLQLYIYTYIHVGFPCFTIVVNSCVLYVLGFISLYLFIVFILYLLTECKQRTEKRCHVADYKILWKQTLINLSNIVDTFIKRDF